MIINNKSIENKKFLEISLIDINHKSLLLYRINVKF
jgi:hypothetical protein